MNKRFEVFKRDNWKRKRALGYDPGIIRKYKKYYMSKGRSAYWADGSFSQYLGRGLTDVEIISAIDHTFARGRQNYFMYLCDVLHNMAEDKEYAEK